MRVCVIPARGGSKRIPGKNIKDFCGRPMIEWSIGAARRSQLFDRIVVSTDDDDVATIARAAGAEAPFTRPAELADDHTPTNPVVSHALSALRAGGPAITVACCLYPTAPLVRVEDLQAGIDLLLGSEVDFTFAAVRYEAAVHRALVVGADGRATPMFPDHMRRRSQDLTDAIHDAGQFYWGTPDAFAQYEFLFDARVAPVVVPRVHGQDIDTPEDWLVAEAMFRFVHGPAGPPRHLEPEGSP